MTETNPFHFVLQQVIQKLALKIAREYTTDSLAWEEAAQDLRQPYWDWAKRGGAVPPPELISRDNLHIALPPDGEKMDVANPFRSYSFRSKESVAPFPEEFTRILTTVRNRFSPNPINEIVK